MSTRAVLLIGSLVLCGFAVAVVLANTETEPEGMMGFHGSEASLKLLAAEAQRCGLPNAKIERTGKFLALMIRTAGPADSRASCVLKWVFGHPEAKIGLLGNQALASESRH